MQETLTEEPTLYTLPMLSQILNLPLSTLRRWCRRRLLVPVRQVNRLAYFDFSQVVSARNLSKLMTASESPQNIEGQLALLAKSQADPVSALAELDVVIDGRNVLIRQDTGLRDAYGQFRIDFYRSDSRGMDVPNPVLNFPESTLDSSGTAPTFDQFLRKALELEDAQNPHGAIEVYRAMLMRFGPTSDTCFALAETFYATGDLVAARERYYVAVELDEGFVEARASLACLLVELGELESARAEFEKVLEFHPDYPDVHFHLAKLLEGIGDASNAKTHWIRFLELSPKTPWSDEARQRLGLLANE